MDNTCQQDKIRGKIAYVKMSEKHMSPTGL